MSAAQPSAAARNTCPCCGDMHTREIYRVESVPVQSCVLLGSREDALAFARHSIALRFCDSCGFVYNADFEERLVDYALATEESQHFSATFGRFASELIGDIARRFDLTGKTVVEIGCGKGDFLIELCARSRASGLGIDPGYLDGRQAKAACGRVRFLREYFRPDQVATPPDFVVCRHTLEHIAPVHDFVTDVLGITGGRSDVVFFFETPDAGRVLSEGAFWDIYFEHCSYFSTGTHADLFRRAGMVVTDITLMYGGQYIIQYARPAGAGRSESRRSDGELDALRAVADGFPGRVSSVQERWRDLIETRHNAGKRIAIWGGGSKAVSFLTTLGIESEISAVVDINPFKQGRFLPGSGHKVVAPAALLEAPPDCVIAMNPIYVEEIRSDFRALGLAPEVLAV